MKKFKCMSAMSVLVAVLVLGGCASDEVMSPDEPQPELVTPNIEAPETLPVVTIEFEGFGTVKAELYPHIAPNTVNNFISLANSGYYDGVIVHRIEEDFVLQMGDPTGTGAGGPGYSIEGEFTGNGVANDLKHTKGVLSMARAQDPNSAGSQFFVMLEDAPHLDGAYASFGKVTEGLEVVEAIEAVERVNGTSKPLEDVIMTSVSVETFGVNYEEPVTIKE